MTDRSRPQRRTLAALVAAVLAATLGVLVVGPATDAVAANLASFDPGFIISDAVFYDATTMTTTDIQAFLAAKGAACARGADGSACLKDYRETTWTRAATDRCVGGYTGATDESAAGIVAKVAAACGINPQVLLVTLQKEQGLVTTTGPTANKYRSAMGYGCPDTAVCDAQYYGFFNQVYSAASQLRNYALNPTRYAHRAGVVNTVRYNPNVACGSSQVYIQNQATASLYNYTPYQPNAAALAAGYGTGDGCSSYGNRNFWNYFTDWFGPTTQRVSIGGIDGIGGSWNGVSLIGWALDPDTVDPIQIHVYVDGHAVMAATANVTRTDIGAAYHKGDNHGFALAVPAPAGAHTVCVYAIDSVPAGPNPQLGCGAVTVPSQTVIGSLEIATGGVGTLTASGWALDPDTTDPIAVHIYVDGAAIRGVSANRARTDIGAAYGKGDNHGYSETLPATPGVHTVCVYGIDANGGANPQLGCRSVTVASASVNNAPLGALENATTATGQITATGWALDPDTTDPIQVHLYLDGRAVVGLYATTTRTDIGATYGKGDNHGYSATLPATPGTHTLCAYAIDSTLTGPNPQIGCRSVTVPAAAANRAPFGSLDTATATTTTITVAGWALDPDTSNPIQVHVYLDGRAIVGLIANTTRTDVGAAYGQGDNHGYNATLPATPGTHTLCTYAIDSTLTGPNPQIGCRSVTVPAAPADRAPIGALESVTGGAQSITASGWALDPDTTNPIQVHLYVDGSAVLARTASDARPDIGAAQGMGDNHGYALLVAATAGTHTVCVYAIDSTPAGPNPQLGCRDITVTAPATNAAPIGFIDQVLGGAGSISVAGWAIDPDTAGSILVHVYLDGSAVQGLLANVERTDIGAAYGMGNAHGYSTSLAAAPGQHTVCVYAIDASLTGPNPQLGCRSATVS